MSSSQNAAPLCAKLDFDRAARTGFGETVYAPGKTPDQLVDVFRRFAARKAPCLATRATAEQAAVLEQAGLAVRWDAASRTIVGTWSKNRRRKGRIAVLTGGLADVPVAEEAACTLAFFGFAVQRHYDVGVAGLHRLLNELDAIRKADVVIAVAGMEGALASVVGGLVSAPVVAVPTSVGYGTGAGGRAALLAMLNSCAEGVTVVNVDNGFGAAVAALRICNLPASKRRS